MKKENRKNLAVSEVLDVILLLGIAVSLFSVISFVVLSYPFNPSTPKANIIAYVQGDNILIDHLGGENLELENKVNILINDTDSYEYTVNEIFLYSYPEAVDDGYWNIGENIIINTTEFLNPPVYTEKAKVYLTIIDVSSNSLLFTGKLKEAI